LTKNWLFSGLKKPAGLPGFEDRASGRPGLRKIGQAGKFYRPGQSLEDIVITVHQWASTAVEMNSAGGQTRL